MAGKRVVHVWREHLMSSDAWQVLNTTEMGCYLLTLCLFTKTELGNPLRGCLCVGNRPRTLDEWRLDMKFRRLCDAQQVWERLHDVGLFETVEIGGCQYTHVTRFEENQDRFRRPGSLAPVREFTDGRQRSDKDRTKISQRSDKDPAKISHGTNQSTVENKQLANRKSAKVLLDNDDRSDGSIIVDNHDDRSIGSPALRGQRSRGSRTSAKPVAASELVGQFMHNMGAAGTVTPYNMTIEELVVECAACEPPSARQRAAGMWRKRIKQLEAVSGGVDFLRDALMRIRDSQNPGSGKDVGAFDNAAAWLNSQTADFLRSRGQ